MKLSDLQHLTTHTLLAGQTLYRVQRARAIRQTVRRGPLKLAPPGILAGRFDLRAHATAYLAESPETALLEAVFRREVTFVSLAQLKQRELVSVHMLRDMQLGDLRRHTTSWPVLQSLRHGETQELAENARVAGFDGLIYHSAQQFNMDCFLLFDPPADASALLASTKLVASHGAVHRWVAATARISCVPMAP